METRKVNYQNVSWFWDYYRRGSLDMNPSYQRRSVWNQSYRNYFIETVILGYPAPAIFLYEEMDGNGNIKLKVVDGKQRLTTIFKFLSNEFPVPEDSVLSDYRELLFEDLPEKVRKSIFSYQFSIEYINSTDSSIINNIFDRINRNVAKLTRQELRHAKYNGSFIKASESMAQYMIVNSPDRFPQIAESSKRQMKDVEFTSILLLQLEEGNKAYKQDEIDNAYSERDEEWDSTDYVKRFKDVIDILSEIASEQEISRGRWKNQSDYYTLFSVINNLLEEEVKFNESTINKIRGGLKEFSNNLINIEEDDSSDYKRYYEAARSATKNISSIRARYEILNNYIREIL